MNTRSALLALLAAGPLLVAGAAHATPTHPATQAHRPAPVRKAATPRPAAVATAAVAAPAATTAAVAAPEPAAAPSQLSVTGTVLGADGQPRAGASVFPTFNPRLIAVTDAKGNFSLQLPAPANPFHLQIEYFGLGSRRVEVDAQHPQPVRIVLGE